MRRLFWLWLPLGLAACPAPDSSLPPATSAAAFTGTDMRTEAERFGGDFTLTDTQGRPFALSSLHGKVVILSFGFTQCPDVCPTELLSYKDALAQLGDAAQEVAVVFVSVDPERDTPELLGRYMRQFHPDFIGLSSSDPQQLAVVKQQYRIVSAKVPNGSSERDYTVNHTTGAYLLDKQGNIAVFEPYGSDAAQIAHDVRLLLSS